MRKTTSILIMAMALSAPAFAADSVENHSFDAKGLTRLRLEHPVGDLTIRGADGNTVEVHMTVDCSGRGCDDKVGNIRFRSSTKSGELQLEVDGYPRFRGNVNVNLDIRVPKSLAVSIDHGVGETEIVGLLNDIDVDAGVGEVEIRSSAKAFRSAKLDAGVGEAELEVSGETIGGGSFLFVGGEREWKGGQGKARLDLEVGVGSATVTLD